MELSLVCSKPIDSLDFGLAFKTIIFTIFQIGVGDFLDQYGASLAVWRFFEIKLLLNSPCGRENNDNKKCLLEDSFARANCKFEETGVGRLSENVQENKAGVVPKGKMLHCAYGFHSFLAKLLLYTCHVGC